MLRPIFRHLLLAVSATGTALLLAAGVAHAQALFQPLGDPNSKSITVPAGNTPQGVAVADFNHDGMPDMVVANQAANSISVYLASGPGTFNPPTTYAITVCGQPTGVLAADLNLNGLQDIVVTCKSTSSNLIEVLLNQGNGTFMATNDQIHTIVLGTGKAPVAIASGDFNNDGHPDLAVADSGDGTVTLFLSSAANNFTSYNTKTLSGLGTPSAITAGDFDNSGNLDLAVTDSAGNSVHILKGDGQGSFTPMASLATGADPEGIVAGDFLHSGFLDLATVNAGDGTVSVFVGQGGDAFQPAVSFSVGPTSGTGAKSILAMDVNGDGYLDVVTGDVNQNQVAVLMNNGDGTAQPVEYYSVPSGPAYLAAGDFNHNGKPDLAITQQNAASVSVLVNNTLPTPEPGGLNYLAPQTLTNGHGNMADGVATADFNNDGYPDIAASYLEDNAVRVLLGNGTGSFNTAAEYPVGHQPYWVVAGDLNNDGYADLVTTNTADGTVSVLMNTGGGTGTFGAAKTYNVGHFPFQVAIGDLNGDGIPDLAVTNMGDNTVSVLLGQSDGTFQPYATPLQTCINPYGVAIGDFRRTGQNDIAVTCFQSGQLEIFLNNYGINPNTGSITPLSFQPGAIYDTDSFPTSLVIGDFNRDGNLDIVTGNSIANDVSFFAGNGDGTFKTAVNSFALNFPDSIAAGDVNGDGILDLVTVAANFQEVAVLLGKGDGTFQQRVEFASGQQPWAVALADFNLDGKLDIVTANTVNRVNLTTPANQARYMTEFPPTQNGGPSLNVLLNASGTKITLIHSPNGLVPFNSPVILTATVAAALGGTTPTGSVTFEDSNGAVLGGGPVTLISGTAFVIVPSLGSGSHQITVLYSGDVLYQPNTVTGPRYVVKVGGTAVNFTVQPTTVASGGSVSYTATVGTPSTRNDPTGTVTVYVIFPDGSVFLADGPHAITGNGNGTASYSGTLVDTVPPGTYGLYAVYTPLVSGFYKPGSSSTVEVTAVQ